MSYAYLKARNFRWWFGFGFSVWVASTIAAATLIVFVTWPADDGMRSGLAQARFWPDWAQIEWRWGERAPADDIVGAYDRCIARETLQRHLGDGECQKIWRDVSLLFLGSPTAGGVVAAGILFFAARRRKNKNRDEQLRGSQIATARQLARRVNKLDPD